MTAFTLSRAPLMAGEALFAAVAHSGLWALSHVLKAPFTSIGLAALCAGSLMAGANALFLQHEKHPAPLFGPAPAVVEPVIPAGVPIRPVIRNGQAELPAVTPQPVATVAANATAGSASATVGNKQVFDLQEKLRALGLFNGTSDGYYGPRTAEAIRAFEQQHGLPTVGALSAPVMAAIESAPVRAPVPDAKVASAPPASMPEAAAPASDPLAQLVTEASAEQAAPVKVASIDAKDTVSAVPPTRSDANPQQAVKLVTDPQLVREVQTGLASLGFLRGPIDGVPGATTSEAIRRFEVFFDYKVTGKVTPDLVGLLKQAGAEI